jgi:hypothetical protein
MRSLPRNSAAALLLIGILLTGPFPGCSGEKGQKPFIARVGTSELAEEDLVRDSVAGRAHPTQQAVNEWIVSELLYQEAARRGLTTTEEYRRQVDAAKRRLAIVALLDQELYAPADTAFVNDAAITQAFAATGAEYTLHEDVVLASYALFADREIANSFRTALLRGTSWNEALHSIQADEKAAPLLLQAATRQYFTQQSLYPQELWKLTRSLGKDEVSFVLKVQEGFYVVKVYGIKKQGDIPDLDYVRNDVRQRLLLEERRARYDRLVATLRARHGVEVRMDRIDTAKPRED